MNQKKRDKWTYPDNPGQTKTDVKNSCWRPRQGVWVFGVGVKNSGVHFRIWRFRLHHIKTTKERMARVQIINRRVPIRRVNPQILKAPIIGVR